MLDSADMTEEQLDAAIFANPSEHDVPADTQVGSESGEGADTSVSPLDDADGQPDATIDTTVVGQEDNVDEDPDGSLSTDDNDDKGQADEPGAADEAANDNPDANPEADLDADNEPIAFQPLRADGKEYPIESIEELYTLASKGINANRKWEESAAGRKVQQTMSKNNLTQDDINLLVELKGGSKDAIMSFLKANDIDPLDMDADAFNGDYKPKDYAAGDFEMALDDVVSRIKDKPKYDETVAVVMEQWDGESKESFYQDPKIMELLNIDMQPDSSGVSMYDRVSPVAEKLKAMDTDNKSDLAYYMEAGKKVITSMNTEKEAKAATQKAASDKKATQKAELERKKKAAASSGGQTAGQKPTDVTELSDEDLDKLLAETN